MTKTISAELQNFIVGSSRSQLSDQGQNNVFAGHPTSRNAVQSHSNGLWNRKPHLSGHQGVEKICAAHANGECPQGTVGTGVGIRPYHQLSGADQAFLVHQHMLYPHAAYFIVVLQPLFPGKRAHHLALLRGLDILVWCKVIWDYRHSSRVKYPIFQQSFPSLDCQSSSQFVSKQHIDFRLDILALANLRSTTMSR